MLAADRMCDRADGKCKWLSDGCDGGNFVKGKCGGPDNRRCCIPNPDGEIMYDHTKYK